MTDTTERLGSINATRLLNRKAVKDLLLATARTVRPFHKFTRVSQDTLIMLNEAVRQAAVSHVKRLPSKGKTI